jgi:hypothetical protein
VKEDCDSIAVRVRRRDVEPLVWMFAIGEIALPCEAGEGRLTTLVVNGQDSLERLDIGLNIIVGKFVCCVHYAIRGVSRFG